MISVLIVSTPVRPTNGGERLTTANTVRGVCELLLIFFLQGCASTASLPPSPSSLPLAWAQTTSERGVLPVGHVISVERIYGPPRLPDEYSTPAQETAKGLAGMYLIVPLAIVATPAVLAGEVMKPDMPANQEKGDEGHVYRHRVRLMVSGQEIVRDELWTYQVGDCVAIRSKPYMLVPALPDQCD